MKHRRHICRKSSSLLLGLVILLPFLPARTGAALQPQPSATADFDSYLQKIEFRLARQHQSPTGFLAGLDSGAPTRSRLRRGDRIIEDLTPGSDSELPGAMLHHWRGTAFVPGARITDFEGLMKDFNSYPRHFAPEVIEARVLGERNDRGVDHITASIRVRQNHLLVVVLDMIFDAAFVRVDAQHGYSISRSARIAEIDSPGTSKERALTAGEEHGFLWRLNTYWSYEEGDGGLYMQIETVSLTRSIPTGLGWAIQPFIESVPRESLEFTLRSASNILRR